MHFFLFVSFIHSLAKDKKKGDKIVLDSQEKAYWRVHKPPVRFFFSSYFHMNILTVLNIKPTKQLFLELQC